MNLSEIERGKVMLNLDHMRRISRALQVNSADLLAEEDNPMRLEEDEQDLVTRLRYADDDAREQFGKVAQVMLPPGSPPARTGTDN